MTSMEQAFNSLKDMDLTELFSIPNPEAQKNTPVTSEAYGKIYRQVQLTFDKNISQ